jgi:hypothetical protein
LLSALKLRHQFGPEDHRIHEGFLENYRDFCCLNFKKVLNLLYNPSRTAYGADLVDKSGIDLVTTRSNGQTNKWRQTAFV